MSDFKIRVGSYYRNRNGDIVGPISDNPHNPAYRFKCPQGHTYMSDGSYDLHGEASFDLVEQVFVSSTPVQIQTLTKREQFAVAALQGIMTCAPSIAVAESPLMVEIAVKQADALLAELAKEQ